MKKVMMVVLVVMVAMSFGACGEDRRENASADNPTASWGASTYRDEEVPLRGLAIGETVSDSRFQFTVTRVDFGYALDGRRELYYRDGVLYNGSLEKVYVQFQGLEDPYDSIGYAPDYLLPVDPREELRWRIGPSYDGKVYLSFRVEVKFIGKTDFECVDYLHNAFKLDYDGGYIFEMEDVSMKTQGRWHDFWHKGSPIDYDRYAFDKTFKVLDPEVIRGARLF